MSGELERGAWQRFDHDPRLPSHQHLRASDLDRDVGTDLLAAAYAEGRLDRDELDERNERLRQAKTLGDLVPLVADVVADQSPPRAPTRSMRAEAEQRYLARRNAALWAFLTPTLICWAIWMLGRTDFPWPVFVTIGTGLGWVRAVVSRQAQVAEIQHRLEEKERRRAERRMRRLHGPGR